MGGFTPKVALNWQVNDDALLYASATNGYKSGGYDFTTRSVAGASFGPEKIWAYEIGAKTDWFDHRLRVNASVFRYDWTALQFHTLVGYAVAKTFNAGNATVNGAELNLVAKPMPGLTLTANATFLSTEYNSFLAYSPPGGLRPFLVGNPNYNAATKSFDASGKQLVDAPKVSLNLSGQKDFDLSNGADMFARVQYSYTSRTYYDPTNLLIASRAPYSLVGAEIGYSPPASRWQFVLWGNNLADTQYSSGYSASNTIAVSVGAPRTFGVRINYRI
jgi:iron complex outermembrane receptor protein